ncbi:MAG: nuclease [Methylococcales symbiont of Iophon sp. n. MRB-2018]|nr:MAG: nuclease [Methylococcales symbiont of Iophon sp. n. MRB-2018]KAF3980816.1 MAG: nuclease [Methylococcales symbiont of Iophon sp. n. MRB-2018]
MSSHQIHIFISHAWAYSDHYETLSSWIFKESWSVGQASLNFQDFSVPKNDPIHNAANDTQLKNAIYNKISRSHVIIIPSGMYASYSKWIKKEIEGSKTYNKPILAVNPFGQQRKSGVVLGNANQAVGWNKKPVIDAIWNLYRG